MLITSRAAVEYHAMFDLAGADLSSVSVLDCCAGGSSFAAETGERVVAVDPAYALDRDELAARVRASLHGADQMIAAHVDRFEWSWFGDPANRAELRAAATRRFLSDLRRRPGRYIAGALPNLPIASDSFDLVVCSHLLFTWSDRLDQDWHRRALAELTRVARREVRLFPLVIQGSGTPVPWFDSVRADLHAAGHRTHLRPVPYRFQIGADQMMIIEP